MLFFNQYTRAMEILFKLIGLFLSIALIMMVFITSMEVVRRYVFGLSFMWAEELVKFLLVGVTFIGGAGAFRAKGMAMLDLLTANLSGKTKKVIDFINNFIIVLLCSFLSVQGFSYSFSPMVSLMKSPGLKLNMSVAYITIPIGFALIVLFALELILLDIKKIKKGEE